jgi:ribosomal protein S19
MNDANKKQVIKTWSRRSVISPDFVGHTLQYITETNLFLYMLPKTWLDIS